MRCIFLLAFALWMVTTVGAVTLTFGNADLSMSTNNTFYEITVPGVSPSYIPADSTFTLGFVSGITDPIDARWYRYQFTLPQGFTNLSLHIQLSVDNEAQIFLNGQIAAVEDDTVVANFVSPYPEFTLHSNNTITQSGTWDSLPISQSMFQVGVNQLTIFATDNGGAGSFSLMVGEISYTVSVPEPATWGLVILGLMALGRWAKK